MKSSFMAKVLALGRVTIPEPTRELLGIQAGDLVEITVERKTPVKVGDVIRDNGKSKEDNSKSKEDNSKSKEDNSKSKEDNSKSKA